MGARWADDGPRRLPKILRRREAERRRVEAFVAAIRFSSACVPACDHAPAPRPPAPRAPETVEIPVALVRLLVSPR